MKLEPRKATDRGGWLCMPLVINGPEGKPGWKIGERRKLREELQARCNLTELQAVNIINGFHIPDYVRIAEVRAAKEAEEHEN